MLNSFIRLNIYIILRSSYRSWIWVGFNPTTTESCSGTLTNRAIRSWVQLAFRANFVQQLQFHLLFSVISFRLLPSSVARFYLIEFCRGYHMSVAEWTDIYGIHHWKILRSSYRKLTWVGFRPLNFVYMLKNEIRR